MNRTQRRAAMREEKRRHPMAQKLDSGPMQIHHGHTDTHVLVQFSTLVQNLILTPEQADAFIAAVQESKKKLAEYRAKGGKLNG